MILNVVESIEHPIVGFLCEPTADPLTSEGEEMELLQNRSLGHGASNDILC